MDPPQDIQLIYVQFAPASIPRLNKFIVLLGTHTNIKQCYTPVANPGTSSGFFISCPMTYGINNVTLQCNDTSTPFQFKIAEVVIGFIAPRKLFD